MESVNTAQLILVVILFLFMVGLMVYDYPNRDEGWEDE